MKQAAVIVGASSGLGRALAIELASSGIDLVLAARSERDLHAIASDLIIRYKIAAKVLPVDTQQLNETKGAEFVEKCFSTFPFLNQVYVTAAIVDDADAGEKSLLLVRRMQEINFIGIAYLIVPFGNRLAQTQSTIVVVSTIATIRPRSNNMAYASSKISLEYFVKGLQHLYAEAPLKLQIYRLGYMETAMSAGKKLALPVANPQAVAAYLIGHRNNQFRLRYYPRFWTLVAILLQLLPWFVYKKLKH